MFLCRRINPSVFDPTNGSLEELKRGATKISETSKRLNDRDAGAIATGLKTLPNKVDFLDLFDNNIGPAGASKLAQALETDNCQLKTLKLAYNAIGDQGAIRIAQALKNSHCKLEKLDLSGCSIENAGAQAIIDAVKCNVKLKTVFLFGNQHQLEDQLQLALNGKRQSMKKRRASSRLFSL